MARGDECKTTTKANNACISFGITAPVKAPGKMVTQSVAKKPAPKNYGAWGPVFKDKKNFLDMHLC